MEDLFLPDVADSSKLLNTAAAAAGGGGHLIHFSLLSLFGLFVLFLFLTASSKSVWSVFDSSHHFADL